jgi:adenylosuccinate lyase
MLPRLYHRVNHLYVRKQGVLTPDTNKPNTGADAMPPENADSHSRYESPLVSRNASEAMVRLWSPQVKFSTWRKIWLAIAESQQALGLGITDEQIRQMRDHVEDIDFARAADYERRLRHDVMAHIHTFGDAAPAAKGIIHLGCTSATIGDNADLVIMREGLQLIRDWLASVIDALGSFSLRYKDKP